MANDRDQNRRANDNPSTVGGQMNPSSPTMGTEGPSTNLADNNPTGDRPGREGGGDMHAQGMSDSGQNQQVGAQGQKTFRCRDVGFEGCNFEASANDEEELLSRIERHGHEEHNITNIDDQTRNKIRQNIHDRAA